MLINLSNHPSDQWGVHQKETAINEFGDIVDIDFPVIDPEWDIKQISELAYEFYSKIDKSIINNKKDSTVVHLMGEVTFCFRMANMLRKAGIRCVASTTRRNVQIEDGVKKSIFVFVKFREYFDVNSIQ
jgi:hypothetical protein